MIAPDDDTLPPPLTTLTTPPVFALSVVLPADKYMWPPAPLVVEPSSLGATCDYCLSDSWLDAAPMTHIAGTDAARANLRDLVAALEFQTYDTRLLLIVSPTVFVGVFLPLWLGWC